MSADERLAFHQMHSKPVMDNLKTWIEAQFEEKHVEPNSGLGKALNYLISHWDPLTAFLRVAKAPVSNNLSEAMLRIVAQGRKVFLFVGHDEAGQNLAIIQSLVATCEYNRINPLAYLTHVLPRIDDYPAKQIDDLLPHNYVPPNSAAEHMPSARDGPHLVSPDLPWAAPVPL